MATTKYKLVRYELELINIPGSLEELERKLLMVITEHGIVEYALERKEVVNTEAKQIYTEECANCRNNPNAQKPFSKMKRIYFGPEQLKALEKAAKKRGIPVSCFMCEAVRERLKEHSKA